MVWLSFAKFKSDKILLFLQKIAKWNDTNGKEKQFFAVLSSYWKIMNPRIIILKLLHTEEQLFKDSSQEEKEE